MSIPDRFLRIARYKLGELKDYIDQLDEERETRADQEAERRRVSADARADARRELEDAVSSSGASPLPSVESRGERPAVPVQPPRPQRTPDEIARGVRPGGYVGPAQSTLDRTYPPPPGPTAAQVPVQGTAPVDPLAFHYRLLGLEPGADFTAVQAAYNRLAARIDPSRFLAGSQEERDARAIRQRLETSFKALRDALDTTVRRFDLLEFDVPKPTG
jgi:hypothetical protein